MENSKENIKLSALRWYNMFVTLLQCRFNAVTCKVMDACWLTGFFPDPQMRDKDALFG